MNFTCNYHDLENLYCKMLESSPFVHGTFCHIQAKGAYLDQELDTSIFLMVIQTVYQQTSLSTPISETCT